MESGQKDRERRSNEFYQGPVDVPGSGDYQKGYQWVLEEKSGDVYGIQQSLIDKGNGTYEYRVDFYPAGKVGK